MSDFNDTLESLISITRMLAASQTLGPGQVRHAKSIRKTLETTQPNRRQQYYKTFLRDVFHKYGSAAVISCVVGVPQRRIAALSISQRARLCGSLATYRDIINHSAIQELVAKDELCLSIIGILPHRLLKSLELT